MVFLVSNATKKRPKFKSSAFDSLNWETIIVSYVSKIIKVSFGVKKNLKEF